MRSGRTTRAVPVSLATVAAEAGVSPATVSRIVNGETGRASVETVRRVRDAVETLGYRPNPIGRALRRWETRVVAMLAPNLDNPAMAAIAASTEAALRQAGYVMILCDTHDRADLQDEYLDAMRSQLVQGYVIVGAVRSAGLAACVERGDPLVFVGRRAPGGGGAYVGIDDRAAGADVADLFLRRGIAAPAVIEPAEGSSASIGRAAGFVARLVSEGMEPSAVRRTSAPGLSHLAVGYEAAARLVAEGSWPGGLLCVSDLMAYGAYRLAGEHGVAIPGACLLVGIDDNPLNAWITPWLTSIHVPYERFGTAVVEELAAIWGGASPREHLLPHRLVVR